MKPLRVAMTLALFASAGYHDTGALYDLVKPSKNAMAPTGQWNHVVITCSGSRIGIELNGEQVTELDADQWTEKYLCPDSSRHKFGTSGVALLLSEWFVGADAHTEPQIGTGENDRLGIELPAECR